MWVRHATLLFSPAYTSSVHFIFFFVTDRKKHLGVCLLNVLEERARMKRIRSLPQEEMLIMTTMVVILRRTRMNLTRVTRRFWPSQVGKSGCLTLIRGQLWLFMGECCWYSVNSRVEHTMKVSISFVFFLTKLVFFFCQTPFETNNNGQGERRGRRWGRQGLEVAALTFFVQGYHSYHYVLQGPESFFEDASQYNDELTFDDMNLSRPILKVPAHLLPPCAGVKQNLVQLMAAQVRLSCHVH